MTCSYCGKETVETTTTFVEELGDKIIVIKNVPCFKCKECGEVQYRASVLLKIEKMVEELKQNIKADMIVSYPAA